jgi:hypothetical protein
MICFRPTEGRWITVGQNSIRRAALENRISCEKGGVTVKRKRTTQHSVELKKGGIKMETSEPSVEITRGGRSAVISTTVPLMGKTLSEIKLQDNDTLLLTFKMEFDVNEFAKIISKEGGPPSGQSNRAWAKRLAQALIKEGAMETVRVVIGRIISG